MECQKHDDYQDAIKWVLSVAEEYAEFGQDAREKAKESTGNVINVVRLLFIDSVTDPRSGPLSSTSGFRASTAPRALREWPKHAYHLRFHRCHS